MTKVELYNIKSKKSGKYIECLKVSVGVYETLVFPSPAELAYLKQFLRDKARSDFQEGLDDVEEN